MLVAVPAVLLLGISKSGFGAGFGSLAVPLMALAVPVPEAAAILMPVLLLMDLLGLAAFRRDFDRKLLLFLIPCGLVGTVIGTLLFRLLSAHTVAGIVGVFTLAVPGAAPAVPAAARRSAPSRRLGAVLTRARRLHQLHRACRRSAGQRLPDPAAPVAAGLHRDHGLLLLRAQPEQVGALRLAGPARLAQHGDLAGAAADRADRRAGWLPAGAPDQRILVLSAGLCGDVPHRVQAGMGRVFK